MTCPCCGGVLDYAYATWARCRQCGVWRERLGEAGGQAKDVMLPASFSVFPSRPHAMGHAMGHAWGTAAADRDDMGYGA